MGSPFWMEVMDVGEEETNIDSSEKVWRAQARKERGTSTGIVAFGSVRFICIAYVCSETDCP